MGFSIQPAANAMMKMKKRIRCSAGWVRCCTLLTAAGCCRIIWLFRTHLLVSWAKQQQQIDTIGRQASSPWPTTTNGSHLQLPCSLLRCWLLVKENPLFNFCSKLADVIYQKVGSFLVSGQEQWQKFFAFLKMKLGIYLGLYILGLSLDWFINSYDYHSDEKRVKVKNTCTLLYFTYISSY